MSDSVVFFPNRSGLLASALVAATACTGVAPATSNVAIAPPEARLVIIGASITTGIVGSFGTVGHAISFTAKRGARVPDDVRFNDPEGPEYEVDVRFLASTGQPFSTQAGGHSFADPQWIAEANQAWPLATPQNRDADFRLAAEAGVALEQADLPVDLAPEQQALVRIAAAGLPEVPKEEVIDETTENTSSEIIGQQRLALTPTNVYTHQIGIYTKLVQYKGMTTWYEHSSTWVRSKSATGVVMDSRVTCNHGACATESSMSRKCYTNYPNRQAALPGFPQCATLQVNETSPGYGCCSSKYSIWGDGGHLCHDDTRYQRDALASWPTNFAYPAYCSDTVASWYAPACLSGPAVGGGGGGSW